MKLMLERAWEPTVWAFPAMPQHFDVYSDLPNNGGSDQAPFNYVGIHGLGVRRDGKPNYGPVRHTQFYPHEEAIPDYLVQASTNYAVVPYSLACADTLLPQGPKPKKRG